MRIHILVGLILALSLSLWSANKIQPLNIKPGLWQTTVSVTRRGEMPLPGEMLNRLKPDQRARLEERMKANSGKAAHTTTHKRCVTRQQLENPNFTKDEQCTWTTLESNRTRMKGTVSCNYKNPALRLRGAGEFVALDREHVKGSIHTTASGNGRTMETTSDFSSKWLGPSCGSVK